MLKANYIFFFLTIVGSVLNGQDNNDTIKTELKFKGQISTWAHFNPKNDYQLYLGARAIPQLNYEIQMPKSKLIDFEASANIYGDVGIHFVDSLKADGNVSPYRVWARYSAQQFELRVGLQKIDFGTAKMLRSLRWFDQVDPRDPLQLTSGVWGVLGRYYFLNNANIWLWALYGNDERKGNEILKTNSGFPEFGGRVQAPFLGGETALSYHHRTSNSQDLNGIIPIHDEIGENRIGFDAKWDLFVGLWMEASWLNNNKDLGVFTNQQMLTLGTDYTFGLGSGLNVVFEHMLTGYSEKAFQLAENTNFSALSIIYPISMFDNITAMVYYDWTNGEVYNFINWFRQFDNTTLYLMAYWNPENTVLPMYDGTQNLYGGLGIQLMYVYNF
jgi:hypothetical protein